MHRVRVKIEGLREARTAVEIARLGADAIGLVFADSPRRVSPGAAREIVAALPPWVATVGVFVNAPAEQINRTVEETGIQYVQLHGDEPPGIVARVRAPCIKAFRVKDTGWAEEVRAWMRGLGNVPEYSCEAASGAAPRTGSASDESKSGGPASGESASDGGESGQGIPRRGCSVLLDAYHPEFRGGSGRRFNWDLIAQARASDELAPMGPIILAGGLDASCVGEAIRTVQPWAVDVASGAESSPGVKDLDKVRSFIEAVRAAGG